MYQCIYLGVKIFSPAHLLPILFFALLGTVSIMAAKTYLSEKGKTNLGTLLACIAALGVLLRIWSISMNGNFDYKEELPLHLCRILALSAPFIMYSRNRILLGVLYFAVFAGTLNANLTPDVDSSFPELLYFTYWMMHSSLLILPIYAISVYGMRITFDDFKRAFIYINIYFVLITLINWILKSNYFYTCSKPASKSILDLFGPWPNYLLFTYSIGFLLMVIFYLPWYFRNRTTENHSA